MLDPVMILAVAFAMALLFAAAAAGKLADSMAFRRVVRDYRLLPERWVVPAAGLLVMTECAIAASWLIGPLRTVAAWSSAVLLTGYGAAIAINLLRGRTDLDCGCSFGAAHRLSWSLVARNVALAALALTALLPPAQRLLQVADHAVAAAASLAGVVLYLAAQQLIGNAAGLAARRTITRDG